MVPSRTLRICTGSSSLSMQSRERLLIVDRFAQTRRRLQERGEREGHLGRVELVVALAGCLRLLHADERHAEAVLIRPRRQAGDDEVGRDVQFLNVLGLPGGLVETDPQVQLAAVRLEADRAAGLDAALRFRGGPRGGAQDMVEAAVVEVHRHPKSRIGGLDTPGELRIEEKVIRIRRGIEIAIERGGAAAAVEPAAFDP